MGKLLNTLWNKEKNYMQLASANYKAISEYNEKILSTLTLIVGLLLMFPMFAAPFSKTKISQCNSHTKYASDDSIGSVLHYATGFHRPAFPYGPVCSLLACGTYDFGVLPETTICA